MCCILLVGAAAAIPRSREFFYPTYRRAVHSSILVLMSRLMSLWSSTAAPCFPRHLSRGLTFHSFLRASAWGSNLETGSWIIWSYPPTPLTQVAGICSVGSVWKRRHLSLASRFPSFIPSSQYGTTTNINDIPSERDPLAGYAGPGCCGYPPTSGFGGGVDEKEAD
jgi:hypothetical protein